MVGESTSRSVIHLTVLMQVQVVTFAQDIEGCKVYPDYMDALHSDFMRLGSIRAALDEPKVVGLDFLAMYRKDRTARGKGKVRTIGGAKARHSVINKEPAN